MTSRHNTYFELRDALAAPGCVVCRLSARSVRRYLEALAFESINDLGLRASLRRSRGFCNLHAWQMLDEAREPFGAGIIYRDVLHACLSDGAQATDDRPCIACDARAAAARRYLDVLVDHASEPEIGRRVEESGGICWAHFALGVSRGGRGLGALARAELAAVELVGDPDWAPIKSTTVVATAGVRAGSPAPRRSPDEQTADPLVALLVGLSAVGAPSRMWDECSVCVVAREAVAGGATALLDAGAAGPPPPNVGTATDLSLCGPHAWIAVDLAGTAAVRSRLEPAWGQLHERLTTAAAELRHAESVGFGPFTFTTPAARQARRDLAERLAPPIGCSICRTQLAAEQAHEPASDTPLCRPHARPPNRGATLELWRALLRDLDEYIRKNDYRFRDETRGPEQRSPWRAVAAVAGGPGLR